MKQCVRDIKKGSQIVVHKPVMKIEDGSCMVWADEREMQRRKRWNESIREGKRLAAIALEQGMISVMLVLSRPISKESPK